MARHPDDKWGDEDIRNRGENYEMNSARLRELGVDLTLGANGQIMVIKHRVARGRSETLYKWHGPQPQLVVKGTLH